jgi:hypothetical protein
MDAPGGGVRRFISSRDEDANAAVPTSTEKQAHAYANKPERALATASPLLAGRMNGGGPFGVRLRIERCRMVQVRDGPEGCVETSMPLEGLRQRATPNGPSAVGY